ncbi:hypothetical protein B0H14DRAFT_2338211, partial [Mycena olivaceomarginata]
QAEKLDPTNPVYPSNLSATFFEMGSYTECVYAIQRSFSHLDLVAEENAPLASRLSLRLAKSLCQALAAGTPISLDNGIADQIDRIEKVYPVDGPESSAWKIWRTWANDPAKRFETLNLARERLLGLPILKKSPFHAREYYSISHDDILSLLEKSSEFEDSSLTGEQDSIDLATFSEAQLSKLAFLFGGVGDARHVFGTVVGLHETLNRLSPKQRKALKVHITLLDVKEHALARDLAAIFFLSKIMSCTDAIDKLELQATLFYFYTAMVMPEYCRQRLCDVIKEMLAKISQDSVHFLPWIRLDSRSVSGIRSALSLWANLPEKCTADYVSQHRYMPQDKAVCTLSLPSEHFSLTFESKWYQNTKAFLPPSALWSRHPEFSIGPSANKQKVMAGFPADAAKHVKTSWIINPTLFDNAHGPDHVLEAIPGNALDVIRQIAKFQQGHPLSNSPFSSDSPGFGHVAAFFDSVIIALQSLGSKLHLEFIHGDIQSQLLRMRAYPEDRVVQNLPIAYTRMSPMLRNMRRDYINGPLGTAVFIVPSLLDTKSSASANQLLNFPAFMGEPTSFSNTYAHLKDREFPSYLGCRAIYMSAFDVTSLAPVTLPRPNQDLAKREDLKTWLIRIFLCTLINGQNLNPMTKIIGPNTIVAFIHLLIHLHKVGYPGHWLGDFLGTLLSNTLVTNILPYTDPLPISPKYDWTKGRPVGKLHLEPWIADMEAIVARIHPALPFVVPLPAKFPTADDIGLYRAHMYFYGEHSSYDPLAGLLFFNSSKVRLGGEADWPRHISAILRGDGPCKASDVSVLLTIEALSWGGMGQVQWRMSRARVARMKAEGWGVAVYGTHDGQLSR